VLGDERDRQRAEAVSAGEDPDKARAVATEVIEDRTKTVINKVVPTSDVPFDYTVNPYRGCAHGCIYCFARPYHEFLGYSCGLDFETKLIAKPDAPRKLAEELSKRSWDAQPIVMSAITDVYQPIEKDRRITRGCLEVMADCMQPVSTMTKGTLVLRDVDLWQKLGASNAARVVVTLVTLDDDLAGKLEPRASPPSARLRVVRKLVDAGVPVGVNIAPVIPGLTDHELPRLMEAAADAGARRVAWVLLRLPYQLKALWLDWMERHLDPARARRVESLLRQAHGGKLYDASPRPRKRDLGPAHDVRFAATGANCAAARYSNEPAGGFDGMSRITSARGRGTGGYAEHLRTVFDVTARKLHLNQDICPLSRKHFRRPTAPGRGGQMALFLA
jgi:DNA repair photolyase